MGRVFIGIGSNEGDREANISRAIYALGAVPGVRVMQMASLYQTRPVGGPPQDEYLNTVVELDTDVPPADLLAALKQIERRLGRVPSPQRWGPRVIDLDILLYDGQRINDPGLIIPHEQLARRRFVLEPLAQLAPELLHPGLGRTITQLLEQLCEDEQPAVSSQR